MKCSIAIISALIFAMLFIAACQSSRKSAKLETPAAEQIQFAHIEAAGSFNVPLKGTSVIRSEAEWNEWWESIGTVFPAAVEKRRRLLSILKRKW